MVSGVSSSYREYGIGWQCLLVKCPENGKRINAPIRPEYDRMDTDLFLKTEELAELHAIIQAIEYERSLRAAS
jgi:hypothetical protein